MSKIRVDQLETLDSLTEVNVADLGGLEGVADRVNDPETGLARRVIYVDTVADLQALPTSELVDGQQVQVSRYHSLSDYDSIAGSGGGVFTFRASFSKALHDGGLIISTTVPVINEQAGPTFVDRHVGYINGEGESDSGGHGCWVRSFQEIRMSMFGAVPDDPDHGIANTTILQLAGSAERQYIRTLEVDVGTYYVDKTTAISWDEGKTLVGVSRHGSVIKFQKFELGEEQRLFFLKSRTAIKNLTLHGNRNGIYTQGRQGAIIYCNGNYTDITLEKLDIIEPVGDGFYYFFSPPDGAEDLSNVIVRDCKFVSPGRQSIACTSYDGVVVDGCTSIDGTINFEAQLSFGARAQNVLITNCTVVMKGNYPHGIYMKAGQDRSTSGKWQLSNCNVYGGNITIEGTSDFSGSVVGCYVKNPGGIGLNIPFEANDLAVTNFTAENCTLGILVSRSNGFSATNIKLINCEEGFYQASPGSVPSDNMYLNGVMFENCLTAIAGIQDFRDDKWAGEMFATLANLTFRNCPTVFNFPSVYISMLSAYTIRDRVSIYGWKADNVSGDLPAPATASVKKLLDVGNTAETGDVADRLNALLDSLRESGNM